MKPGRETNPRSFLEEWREGDAAGKTVAVAKRLAPAILFIVFMYFFTIFSSR